MSSLQNAQSENDMVFLAM